MLMYIQGTTNAETDTSWRAELVIIFLQHDIHKAFELQGDLMDSSRCPDVRSLNQKP